MRNVVKNLIDGLSEVWIKVGKYWRVPCKSAITQARQRLAARVMSQLFHSRTPILISDVYSYLCTIGFEDSAATDGTPS